MKTFIVLLIFVLHLSSAQTQSFVDITLSSGIIHKYNGTFGSGISFMDWDKDGWPDLSYCNKNAHPQFYHNENGSFVQVPHFITNNGNMRSLLWVDYDNDGDYDISVSRHNGLFKLYRNDNFVFTDVSLLSGFPIQNYLSYAHTWADYDRDGDLDVYLGIYDETPGVVNLLLRNNGDGTFSEVATQAGVNNGSKFSFMGAWVDINRDLWPDLYVINDKYYPNALYINNGDGTFTDISNESEAGLITNPMTATIDDYDHDLDLDIYMTNTNIGNTLLNNDGFGGMTELADEAGVQVFDTSWGALFSDFNHDMWPDLLVTTGNQGMAQTPDRLFINNQNGTFTHSQQLFPSPNNNSYCPVEADYDNDGDNDVAILCAMGHLSQFFRNDLATGNHIKINLESTLSAPNGIGSWIDVFVDGIQQSRYTFCGENYLGQNSQYELFALAENNQADSIIISWLSGHQDKFYNVEANQCISIIEGSSLQYEIPFDGEFAVCSGELITLDGGEFESHLWNTGHTGQFLEVSTTGEYFVQVQNTEGFTIESNMISLEFIDAPQINASIEHALCYGDSSGIISLDIQGLNAPFEIMWNNGANSEILTNLVAGIYEVTISNNIGCQNSNSFEISQPLESLNVSVDSGNETENGNAYIYLNILGGSPPYEVFWTDYTLQGDSLHSLTSGIYLAYVLDANGCDHIVEVYIYNEIQEEAGDYEEMNDHSHDSDNSLNMDNLQLLSDYQKNWEQILLFNTAGQLLHKCYNCAVQDLLLNSNSYGIYILELKQAEVILRNKIQLLKH